MLVSPEVNIFLRLLLQLQLQLLRDLLAGCTVILCQIVSSRVIHVANDVMASFEVKKPAKLLLFSAKHQYA
jgi:hypothetical protein